MKLSTEDFYKVKYLPGHLIRSRGFRSHRLYLDVAHVARVLPDPSGHQYCVCLLGRGREGGDHQIIAPPPWEPVTGFSFSYRGANTGFDTLKEPNRSMLATPLKTSIGNVHSHASTWIKAMVSICIYWTSIPLSPFSYRLTIWLDLLVYTQCLYIDYQWCMLQ